MPWRDATSEFSSNWRFRSCIPARSLLHAPYLDVLVALMESCAAGRKRRVIVNLPPGYMKSMLISIMYVAWRLGVDPTLKFICISYGDDLAHKHSASTRKLMQSPVYRAIFPGTVLDKKAENWLSTTKGGHRYATAVGSDITGFRATEIIVDDPIEPEKGVRNSQKKKCVRGYQVRSSLASRTMPKTCLSWSCTASRPTISLERYKRRTATLPCHCRWWRRRKRRLGREATTS